MFAENFLDCGKFPQLCKNYLIAETFLDCESVIWLWKSSLVLEKFLDSGKVPWLWKSSLIVEILIDCGILTFLTAEKFIGLIILKLIARILILMQKLSLQYIKSILCLVENLSTNIQPLMRDNNKSLFIPNQTNSQKL